VRYGVAKVQSAIAHMMRPIVVVDAETDDDLATLAEAVVDDLAHLLAGSAGFSTQLARQLGKRDGKRPAGRLDQPASTVLTVAGSRHASSVRQVAALEQSGVETLRLNFERGHLDPSVTERAIERMAKAFDEGRSLTLTTADTPNSSLPGNEIAKALAAVATDLRIRDRYDAMILTGGDVAGAACARLEADAIWLGGEVLPAIPWGTLAGGIRPGLPVITKAGSFGAESAMVDSIAFLTQSTN